MSRHSIVCLLCFWLLLKRRTYAYQDRVPGRWGLFLQCDFVGRSVAVKLPRRKQTSTPTAPARSNAAHLCGSQPVRRRPLSLPAQQERWRHARLGSVCSRSQIVRSLPATSEPRQNGTDYSRNIRNKPLADESVWKHISSQ